MHLSESSETRQTSYWNVAGIPLSIRGVKRETALGQRSGLTADDGHAKIRHFWVYSSVVERAPDKREAGSSILPRPTRKVEKLESAAVLQWVEPMKIQKFEDIRAWQEARSLTNMVYSATRQTSFKRDLGLASQIQRAAVSVMANIAEGFETQQRRRFVNFLRIANASVAEVKSHLYVALDQGYIYQSDFDKIYSQAQTVGKLIGGFIAYLQKGDEHTK